MVKNVTVPLSDELHVQYFFHLKRPSVDSTSPYIRCLLSGSRDERSCIPSGPCLSAASWSAPLPAFIAFYLAGLGVNGFGHFCRNKSGSAAGPKPGNTENHFNASDAITRYHFLQGLHQPHLLPLPQRFYLGYGGYRLLVTFIGLFILRNL